MACQCKQMWQHEAEVFFGRYDAKQPAEAAWPLTIRGSLTVHAVAWAGVTVHCQNAPGEATASHPARSEPVEP